MTNKDDEQHLRLLSTFHYIVGGLTALVMCFPLIHFGLGFAMVFAPGFFDNKPGSQPPPLFIGWILMIIGGLFFLSGQAFAICIIAAGRFLAQRRRYLFIFIVACIQCAFMPFGTVLGVFTIIVLSRESVKALFDPHASQNAVA